MEISSEIQSDVKLFSKKLIHFFWIKINLLNFQNSIKGDLINQALSSINSFTIQNQSLLSPYENLFE